MKSGKTAPIITVCLVFFLSGLCAGAQQMDWDKSMAAARAARQRGEYANAAALYKSALAIQEKTLGPDHVEVAASLNNLAVLYQDEYMDAQAEPLYRRSLAIWEKY